MASRSLIVLALVALLASPALAGGYVVLAGFDADDPYDAAARRLAKHHRTEHLLRFDPARPEAVVPVLREIEPTHVAVVLRPEQIDVDTVRRFLKVATTIDADPFVDFEFGYVTGATAKEALAFVENIVRASRKRAPRRVGSGAVWGGGRPCSSSEGRYAVGAITLPQRSLVFTAPDGKSGRDQAFIDEHLADLEGCGAIVLGGHGMPWEIGNGPRAEDVEKLSLFPAVVLNYACYTGVTRRWPERKYDNGSFVHLLNEIEAKRSFALATIRAGAVGYVAYVNPRPAGPETSIDLHHVLAGATLGAARREDYAKVVLGYLGFGEPGIVVGDWPKDARLPVSEVDPVRHMMLDGSTGGILYGDPALRPFAVVADADPVKTKVVRRGADLQVEIRVDGQNVYVWCADPFRRFEDESRTMAMKAYVRLEIPDDLPPVGSVSVTRAVWGGADVETLPTVWAEEVDQGRRYLHLKPGWGRDTRRGDVEIALVVSPRTEVTPRPATEPARPDLSSKEVCLGLARQVGERVLALGDDIEGENAYDGAAGVAMFLFDLHAATGEDRWLGPARALLGRSLLIADEPGLWVGVAGVGQVCVDAWRATGDAAYLARARECAARVGEPKGTDVIYGAAGTGVFLLNLHLATGEDRWLDDARDLGDFLARHAVREGGRAHWPVEPGSKRVYLGFAHGAAGIGTFLVELSRRTGEKPYLDLALEAAAFVSAHAVADGPDGWKWSKMVPPEKDAFPVQWCHGSPGIGLFYLALRGTPGSEAHEAALRRCLASTRREGRTARAWGIQCHGVSGNAELFLDAGLALGDPALLETAREFARDLVGPDGARLAYDVGDGETRPYGPEYMTGLAGIGRFFLRLADPEGVGPAFMIRR